MPNTTTTMTQKILIGVDCGNGAVQIVGLMPSEGGNRFTPFCYVVPANIQPAASNPYQKNESLRDSVFEVRSNTGQLYLAGDPVKGTRTGHWGYHSSPARAALVYASISRAIAEIAPHLKGQVVYVQVMANMQIGYYYSSQNKRNEDKIAEMRSALNQEFTMDPAKFPIVKYATLDVAGEGLASAVWVLRNFNGDNQGVIQEEESFLTVDVGHDDTGIIRTKATPSKDGLIPQLTDNMTVNVGLKRGVAQAIRDRLSDFHSMEFKGNGRLPMYSEWDLLNLPSVNMGNKKVSLVEWRKAALEAFTDQLLDMIGEQYTTEDRYVVMTGYYPVLLTREFGPDYLVQKANFLPVTLPPLLNIKGIDTSYSNALGQLTLMLLKTRKK